MTEVVINKCFGGFGISAKALMFLIKKKAKCVRKVKIADWDGGSEKYKNEVCYSIDWKQKFEKDLKEEYKRLGNGFYVYRFCGIITDKEFIYSLEDKDKTRADPDLIKVVKKLGKKANGEYAELMIVKIPKGAEWTIEDYDGRETVEEAHEVFG